MMSGSSRKGINNEIDKTKRQMRKNLNRVQENEEAFCNRLKALGEFMGQRSPEYPWYRKKMEEAMVVRDLIEEEEKRLLNHKAARKELRQGLLEQWVNEEEEELKARAKRKLRNWLQEETDYDEDRINDLVKNPGGTKLGEFFRQEKEKRSREILQEHEQDLKQEVDAMLEGKTEEEVADLAQKWRERNPTGLDRGKILEDNRDQITEAAVETVHSLSPAEVEARAPNKTPSVNDKNFRRLVLKVIEGESHRHQKHEDLDSLIIEEKIDQQEEELNRFGKSTVRDEMSNCEIAEKQGHKLIELENKQVEMKKAVIRLFTQFNNAIQDKYGYRPMETALDRFRMVMDEEEVIEAINSSIQMDQYSDNRQVVSSTPRDEESSEDEEDEAIVPLKYVEEKLLPQLEAEGNIPKYIWKILSVADLCSSLSSVEMIEQPSENIAKLNKQIYQETDIPILNVVVRAVYENIMRLEKEDINEDVSELRKNLQNGLISDTDSPITELGDGRQVIHTS